MDNTFDDFSISEQNVGNNNNNDTSTTIGLNFLANPDKIKNKLNPINEHSSSNDSDNSNSDSEKHSDDNDIFSSSSSNNDRSSSRKSRNSSIKFSSRKANNEPQTEKQKEFTQPNTEEIKKKKIDILQKIQFLKERGKIPKYDCNFDLHTPLDRMEFALESYMKKFQMEKALNTYWMGLIFIINLLEMGTQTYDVFDIDLGGWSTKVDDQKENYYDIFMELHEKYNKNNKAMSPEVRLMFALIGSGLGVHISNKQLKANMNKGSEGGMDGGGGGGMGGNNMMGNMMSSMFSMFSKPKPKPNQPEPNTTGSMRGPVGVEDILNSIEKEYQ
jgi:hypothetical protein